MYAPPMQSSSVAGTFRASASVAPVRRVMSAVAAASAAGLSVAHFVVARRRPRSSRLRFAGRVVVPAVAALLPAAAAGHAAAFPEQTFAARRAGLVLGAVTMGGLAVVSTVSARVRPRGHRAALLTPAGPGLWSLVGTPSFLVLAVRDIRSPAGRPSLPRGQHAVPARRFGLPQRAGWRPDAPIPRSIEVGGDVRHPADVAWAELVAAVTYRWQRSDLHCVATWSTLELDWGGLPFSEVLDVLIRRTNRPPGYGGSP